MVRGCPGLSGWLLWFPWTLMPLGFESRYSHGTGIPGVYHGWEVFEVWMQLGAGARAPGAVSARGRSSH